MSTLRHPSTASRAPRGSTRRALRGSFLLEALIAVFIIAMAILGLIGLMSRSMQNVDEAKYRGEAAALAATLIGNMWVSDRALAALQAKFESATAGPGYTEFKTLVLQRLPNATDPVVTIVGGATAQASDVTITMTWSPPGEATARQYQTFATVGANN